MFGFLKNLLGKKNPQKLSNPDAGELPKPQNEPKTWKAQYLWYNADDEGNPYGKRFLDCRDFALVMASKAAKAEAEAAFQATRNSDGKGLIDTVIEGGTSIEIDLNYVSEQVFEEGPVFKATKLEDKWDIYYYNDCLLFAKSSTEILVYRAFVGYRNGKLNVHKLECPSTELANDMAINNLHFLILSYLFDRTVPHKIPKDSINNYLIAVQSYDLYGPRACFATYDNIINLNIQDYPLGGNLLKTN